MLAPAWVTGLVNGTFFGSSMAVYLYVAGGHAWVALVVSALAGMLFGTFVATYGSGARRDLKQRLEHLPRRQQNTAIRIADGRDQPSDVSLRLGALAILEFRLQRVGRTPTWLLVLGYGFAVLTSAIHALTSSLWWLVTTFEFGVILLVSVVQPRRLARRAAELAATTPAG